MKVKVRMCRASKKRWQFTQITIPVFLNRSHLHFWRNSQVSWVEAEVVAKGRVHLLVAVENRAEHPIKTFIKYFPVSEVYLWLVLSSAIAWNFCCISMFCGIFFRFGASFLSQLLRALCFQDPRWERSQLKNKKHHIRISRWPRFEETRTRPWQTSTERRQTLTKVNVQEHQIRTQRSKQFFVTIPWFNGSVLKNRQ